MFLLVIAVVIWFYWHIQSYFIQTLFVGVPLTVKTLFELARSFVSKEGVGEREPLFKRVLGTPSGTWYIIIGFILTALLFLTTSSIYVEYDPLSAKGNVEYQLDVTEIIEVEDANTTYQVDRPYIRRLTVSSYERVKGQPHFFKISRFWNPTKLRFTIVRPFGYEPNEVKLKPWSRAYFKAPKDFTEKAYYVLRIMPAGNWLNEPPRLNETDKSKYVLEISIIDGNDYKVDNVLLETICVGAGQETIESMIAAEPREKRHILMYSHLFNTGNEHQIEERAEVLTDNWRSRSTKELKPGNKVTITLRNKITGLVVAQKSWTVAETKGIQNVSIE